MPGKNHQILGDLQRENESLRAQLADAKRPSIEHVQQIHACSNLQSQVNELKAQLATSTATGIAQMNECDRLRLEAKELGLIRSALGEYYRIDTRAKLLSLIKERDQLRAELEKAKQERNAEGMRQRAIYLPQLEEVRARIHQLEQALETAEKALEFYSEHKRWLHHEGWRSVARDALAAIRATKGTK